MAEADRTHAMGLAALRQAADLTQVELARRLGVTEAAISRVEQPHDLLLSTLNSYLGAIGGRASVISHSPTVTRPSSTSPARIALPCQPLPAGCGRGSRL